MNKATAKEQGERPVLLIGPLPPPVGGARVSFFLFWEYLKDHGSTAVRYFDLPVWSHRRWCVDHLKTSARVLRALWRIPSSSKVVIFGSRGFCCTYGVVATLVAWLFHKPVYLRFFGGRPMLFPNRLPGPARTLVVSGLRLAHRLVVQTETGAEEFPQTLQQKVRVVPGYRPMIKSSSVGERPRDGAVRFVYTGALSQEKGTLLLVETFSRLVSNRKGESGPVELHLFGGGPEDLLEKIRAIDGVYCHGQVENSVLRDLLGDYDIFVFPSVYDNEGHPGSIIEALMAGLPVIACDRDVIREVVIDEVNGLLVEAGNGDTLLKTMGRLLHDKALRVELSEGASRTSARYDANNVLPELAHAVGVQ